MKYLCYDGALNEAYTLVQLMKRYPQNRSLFAGTDDEGIWEAAPWLFELTDNFYEMQGQPLIQFNRCIVFETSESLKDVCDYLHTKMYHHINGQLTYYRIWDAAVLMDFLKNASEIDKESFYQIFQSVYVEADENNLLRWSNTPKGIVNTTISKNHALPVIIQHEDQAIQISEAQIPENKNLRIEEKQEQENLKQVEPSKKRRFFLD